MDVRLGRLTLWLGFPAILLIICRKDGLRFRDLATLVVPAAIAVIVVDVAMSGLAPQVVEMVVVFGTKRDPDLRPPVTRVVEPRCSRLLQLG